MLKIGCAICCGLDVCFDFAYARITATKSGFTAYKSHRLFNFYERYPQAVTLAFAE